MKILFAASEGAPFFKTGGLGDVVESLPKALVKTGLDLRVVLPFFTGMNEKLQEKMQDLVQFSVKVGYREQYCGIKTCRYNDIQYYFIDNLYYFNRPNLYGYYDDGERFAYFAQAICEMLEKINFIPDIIHLNDYHVAMIPFLLKEKYQYLSQIKTIQTIHNIEFQGEMPGNLLANFFNVSMERYFDGTVRWKDQLNFLKAGILYSDRITTVSPSYAKEIKTPEFGNGLDQILRMESGKLSGILNGIDYDIYNPAVDPLIFHNFSNNDLAAKALNKHDLQKELNLPEKKDTLLIGIVSRLTYQKGIHLLLEELHNLNYFDVQVVILGTGQAIFENSLQNLAPNFSKKMRIIIDFDVQLAQQIYAGADLFLMPSGFEPCGLTQMIAMRYGTLPLVHEVGGLIDTVVPFNKFENTGTGFGFRDFTGHTMMKTIKIALNLYKNNQTAWQKMQKRAMNVDFSWDISSKKYIDLYQELR